MNWTMRDERRARAYTCKLIDLADEGVISWETLARDLLGWMSESEVKDFARRNDYIQNDPDENE
jgi:hypothetical protein